MMTINLSYQINVQTELVQQVEMPLQKIGNIDHFNDNHHISSIAFCLWFKPWSLSAHQNVHKHSFNERLSPDDDELKSL